MKVVIQKYIVVILLSLILVFIVANLYIEKSTTYAYIVSNELFQSYTGTIELKKKVETKENYYNSILDSLKLEISLCQSSSDPKMKIKQLTIEDSYRKYYNQLVEYNEGYISEEEAKIWTQLNQYVNDYGKKKNYSFILGANGNGSLMYADSALNVTKEIINFSNKKYSGK